MEAFTSRSVAVISTFSFVTPFVYTVVVVVVTFSLETVSVVSGVSSTVVVVVLVPQMDSSRVDSCLPEASVTTVVVWYPMTFPASAPTP